MEPIEPCPFCGEKAVISRCGEDDFRAYCENGCCAVSASTTCQKTYDDALIVWNRRARTPLETELVKALQACDVACINGDPSNLDFSKLEAALFLVRAVLAKANAATGGGVG